MSKGDDNFRAELNSVGYLHALIGKAVWGVQNLEEELNHFLAMHNTDRHEIKRANKRLKKFRRSTLGGSLEEIKKKDVLPDDLLGQLDNFLDERNWLIHRSYLENIDQAEEGKDQSALIKRISSIVTEAQKLSVAAELEMIKHFEPKGLSKRNIAKHLAERYGKEVVEQVYELEV